MYKPDFDLIQPIWGYPQPQSFVAFDGLWLFDEPHFAPLTFYPVSPAAFVKPAVTLSMETDDYANDASTTGVLLTDGTPQTGVIEVAGDEDWFAFTVQAGQVMDFTLNVDDAFGQSGVFWINSPEISLLDLDFLQSGQANIRYDFDTSGTYYLSVRHTGSTPGTYTVSASTLVDDYAGNVATEGAIEIGASISGTVNFLGDFDWFAFTYEQGDIIQFTSSSNTQLRIYDAFNNSYSVDFGNSGSSPLVLATDLVAGQYYIAVGSEASLTDYTVQATRIIDDYGNDISTLGSLATGESVTGRIDYQWDSDWFSITADPDAVLRISIDTELTLNLADSTGRIVQFAFPSINGTPELILNNYSGEYFAFVQGATAGTDYTIEVTTIEDDYTANTSTVGDISIGTDSSGRIDYRNDQDWFAVTLAADEVVRFTVENIDNIVLRDSDGYIHTYSFINAEGHRQIIAEGLSGEFFLNVADFEEGLSYTVQTEILDDDFASNAATLGELSVGGFVAGRIDFYDDRDWFKVTLNTDDAVRFTLDTQGSFSLRDSSGAIVLSSYAANTSYTQSEIIALDLSGDYFLEVQGYTEGQEYTVQSEIIADDFSGTTATTGAVNIGDSIDGRIDFVLDRDWFALILTADDIVALRSTDDVIINLADSDGNFVRYGTRDDDGNMQLIVGGLDGAYFVSVSSRTAGVEYTLDTAFVVDDHANDITTSTVLTFDGAEVSGSIDYPGDEDWFAFDIETDTAVNFALDGQVVLNVYDEDGRYIHFRQRYDDATSSDVTVFGLDGGRYYIAVNRTNGNYDYTLSGTYIDDDFASNITTTGTIDIGSTATGRIDYAEDSDWFRFETDEDVSVFFALDTTSVRSRFDTVLYDASGNEIQTNINDGDALTFAAGTYYFATQGRFSTDLSDETYTLTLTKDARGDYASVLDMLDVKDFVYDDMRDLLYITTSGQDVLRYDVQNGAFLSAVTIGDSLGEMSLSVDGRTLFVAQEDYTAGTNAHTASFSRINLDTLVVDSYNYQTDDTSEVGVSDLALDANGNLLVMGDVLGSGFLPLRSFSGFDADLASTNVTPIGFFGDGRIAAGSSLVASSDGQYILIVESNTSPTSFSLYSAATQTVLGTVISSGINTETNAISSQSGLVAIVNYNEFSVYNFELDVVADLASVFGATTSKAAAFSPDGAHLFVWTQDTNNIAVLETNGFTTVGSIFLSDQDTPTDYPPGFRPNIVISDDGTTLFSSVNSNIEIIDLSVAAPYAVPDIAATIRGTYTDDTLIGTVSDDVIQGFSGDDALLGGVGDDWLEGGSGNDTLTGGDGHDILRAGDGDDIVYADMDDDFANVNGGRDTDTLYLTSEDHVSYDYRMQLFETAFVRNAAGETLHIFTTGVNYTRLQTLDFDDTEVWSYTVLDTDTDPLSSRQWEARTQFRNDNNETYEIHYDNDDGTSQTVRFDVEGDDSYDTLEVFYTASGALSTVINHLDNGRRVTTDYNPSGHEDYNISIFTEDLANEGLWQSVLDYRNDANQRYFLQNQYDNGLRVDIEFDVENDDAYFRLVTNVDDSADGTLLNYQSATFTQNDMLQTTRLAVLTDNNISDITDFDIDDTELWATQRTRIDVDDAFDWGMIVEQRDALGRTLYYAQTNEGSYDTVNEYDLFDTQIWSRRQTYIDDEGLYDWAQITFLFDDNGDIYDTQYADM